jgi:tRNA threonylcarbamoyladenosine biosynthesis protein TsaB
LNILVIDTASPLEIIAANAGESAVETSALINTSHSVTILDTIDRCLTKLGLAAGDLDVIGVGVGPGSFTGIRIAVSTARMLAQVLGKPLVGLQTQLIYAVCVEAERGDNILVAFDAKKGRVFGALYRKSGQHLAPDEVVAPGDYPIQRLLERVDASRPTFLIGSGIEKYPDAVSALTKRVILRDFAPSGKMICDLAFYAYGKNPGGYGDYNRVVPCYARKSDAETAKESRVHPETKDAL